MDFQIQITEITLADFEKILAYSWANFPAAAEHFGNAILDHLDLLKRFPYAGSPVTGRRGVRQLVHTRILINYRVREGPNVVEILHFWHGARGDALLQLLKLSNQCGRQVMPPPACRGYSAASS